MSERAYTVRELDELRSAVRWVMSGDHIPWAPGETSRQLPNLRVEDVEERVRTHMLAGHTGADIRAEYAPKQL